MKIKYIKENFFDDTDNIPSDPNNVISQEYNDAFNRNLISLIKDTFTNLVEGPDWVSSDWTLSFPILHTVKYSKITDCLTNRVLHTSLIIFHVNPKFLKNNTKSTYDGYIEMKAQYNSETNELVVSMNWEQPGKCIMSYEGDYRRGSNIYGDGTADAVLITNISRPYYHYVILNDTSVFFKKFVNKIKQEVSDHYNLSVSRVTLKVFVNGLSFFDFNDDGDYWKYIEEVTGYTKDDFESEACLVRPMPNPRKKWEDIVPSIHQTSSRKTVEDIKAAAENF